MYKKADAALILATDFDNPGTVYNYIIAYRLSKFGTKFLHGIKINIYSKLISEVAEIHSSLTMV